MGSETKTDNVIELEKEVQETYQGKVQQQDNLTKLDDILRKREIGRYINSSVAQGVRDSISEYRRARASIGTNGNKAHDIFTRIKYATGISSPEKEMAKSKQKRNNVELNYRKIEADLRKLEGEIKKNFEKEHGGLDELMEGRKFAKDEINWLNRRMQELKDIYAMMTNGNREELPEAYRDKSLSEIRKEYDKIETEHDMRHDDVMSLNSEIRRMEKSIKQYKMMDYITKLAIKGVISERYEQVQTYEGDTTLEEANFGRTIEKLVGIRETATRVKKDSERTNEQAVHARDLVLKTLYDVSNPSVTKGEAADHEIEYNKKLKDINDKLESSFDTLDLDVDRIQQQIYELPL